MTKKKTPKVCWKGQINPDAPDLGLPAMESVQGKRLYTANEETGTYSHHSYITYYKGQLFAAWSNHLRDEDGPGQRVLMSQSDDLGATWAEWKELFPPRDRIKPKDEQDWDEDRVLIPNGFAEANGALYAVGEVHVMSSRRGFGRIARQIDNGVMGPIFWTRANPPAPRPGFDQLKDPSDPAWLEIAEAINEYLARPEHLPSWEFLHHSSRPIAADGHQMCEPTQAWQLPDGTWAQFLRDLGLPGPDMRGTRSYMNYVRFSEDDGVTWTKAVRTNFPDACSRSAASTLPGGAVAVVNNPGASRDPLVLSLSADGLNFDHHAVIAAGAPQKRYEGAHKGKGFQYPRAVVAENSLLIMYSVNKEDVEVMTIPLSAVSGM